MHEFERPGLTAMVSECEITFPMTAVKERLKTLIEECRSVELLPWQVIMSKIYCYAVKANSKHSDGVE
jgi:hypothetical protein